MAEGRTRMCGRREESIFLRSRGRRPYLMASQSTTDGMDGIEYAYLCNKLRLFEFSIHERDITACVELGTP